MILKELLERSEYTLVQGSEDVEISTLVYLSLIHIWMCIRDRNELDYEKASKIVLEEFRNGKLGKISLETPEEGTKEA